MSITFNDRVAIVTGAGGGLGRCHALDLAKRGAKVVVNDYGVSMDGSEPTSEPANEVVAEIKAAGGEAVANPSSVAEMSGGESIIQQAMDEFGSIDGVVCVAGILREKMLFNMAATYSKLFCCVQWVHICLEIKNLLKIR